MNPIGKIFDLDELDFLAELTIKHDLVIVSDEVYEHLIFDGRPFHSMFGVEKVRDRVVRIGSAGKSFSLTGWKVGYVTASAKLLAPIARAHQYVTFTTPPALQSAVAVGLSLPDSYFVELRATLASRRDILVEGLKSAGFAVVAVPATYFVVADIEALDPEGDDLDFCRRLALEAGVTPVPISSFMVRAMCAVTSVSVSPSAKKRCLRPFHDWFAGPISTIGAPHHRRVRKSLQGNKMHSVLFCAARFLQHSFQC